MINSHMLESYATFSVGVDPSETAGIATENFTVQLTIGGSGVAETQSVGLLDDDRTTVSCSDVEIAAADGFKAAITLDADNLDSLVKAGQRFTSPAIPTTRSTTRRIWRCPGAVTSRISRFPQSDRW